MKLCMAKVWQETGAGTAPLNGVAKVAPVSGMELKQSQLGWEATPRAGSHSFQTEVA